MKKLIVNADDFGLTRGVNKGIIRGYRQGIITSATALVNMPAWEHAANLCSKFPGLGVGLHFNLTFGKPVSPEKDIPSLVAEDGGFVRDHEDLAAANPRDIAIELYNQYNRLVRSGIKPTHIDSHNDAHSLENVLPVVLMFASRLKLPVRLVPWAEASYQKAGAMTTQYLEDKFKDRGANRMNFEKLISQAPADTVEIRCHPGMVDADLEACSSYTWQRERELAVVCAYDKEEFPQQYGYKLISFSGLKDPA